MWRLDPATKDGNVVRGEFQAQLALDRKNPASALTTLQAASPIELGQIGWVANISCLYHVYIRGEAYLAGRKGAMPPPPSFRRFSTTAASSDGDRAYGSVSMGEGAVQ